MLATLRTVHSNAHAQSEDPQNYPEHTGPSRSGPVRQAARNGESCPTGNRIGCLRQWRLTNAPNFPPSKIPANFSEIGVFLTRLNPFMTIVPIYKLIMLAQQFIWRRIFVCFNLISSLETCLCLLDKPRNVGKHDLCLVCHQVNDEWLSNNHLFVSQLCFVT